MSMRDALAKLGLGAEPTWGPEAPAAEVKGGEGPPPSEFERRYAAGLWLAQGAAAAKHLAVALDNPSRRRRNDWRLCVDAAVSRLKGAERAAAEGCEVHWDLRGDIYSWTTAAEGVLVALRDPATQRLAKAEVAKAAEALAIEAARVAEAEAAEAARLAAEKAEADAQLAEAQAALAALPDPLSSAQREKLRWNKPYRAKECARAWHLGLDVGHGSDTPPQGWGALPRAALEQYVLWDRPGAVKAYLADRKPQDGEVIRGLDTPGIWIGGRIARLSWSGAASIEAAAALPSGTIVSTIPSSAGWWRLKEASGPTDSAVATFVPGRYFEDLATIRRETGGPCDVRWAMGYYGRHPDGGWARFLAVAWKHKLVVPIDEPVARVLDAIARLEAAAPGLLEPEDYRVWARPQPTQGGGWRLVAAPRNPGASRRAVDPDREQGAQEPGAVVIVGGGTSSIGRRGVIGTMSELDPRNKAPAIYGSGASGGGGQHRWCVLAYVTESTPVLTADGVGHRYSDGKVWRCPGLADGLAAEPKEVPVTR